MAFLIVAAAATTLGGCGQRSLLAVRESGERAYSIGEYTKAEADFQEYVDRLPGDPIGRYNLGRTYLKLSPARPVPAREQLSIAYSQRSQDELVLEELCEALLAGHQNDELYKLLRGRALDRQQVSDYLRLAKYGQKLGDVDEAKQALITAARIDGGTSASVQLAIADFYASLNDSDQAVRRLRMAYYLDPNNGRVVERIRGFGEIPGPTFGLPPEELATTQAGADSDKPTH